jgi:hypothetical protein
MDKVTQQNAANSEESASAAEELSAQAEELQGMVGQFTLSQTDRPVIQNVKKTHDTPLPIGKSVAAHDHPPRKGGVKKNQTPSGSSAPKAKPGNGKAETAEEVIPMNDEVLKEF